MQKLKSVLSVIIIGTVFSAGITIAAAAWSGTDWISTGNTISADSLKSDLDYLKEKVDELTSTIEADTTGDETEQVNNFVIENRTDDPLELTNGRIWLRTDL